MKSIRRIQHTNLETVEILKPCFNISISRMVTFSKKEEILFYSIDRHIGYCCMAAKQFIV